MSYAFTFDARACSGCKACQEACKDKNQLPVGVLWRRVIEVSGGEWHTAGDTWENSVFAYNVSLACNHCTHPKCAGVCPTDAYIFRPDGIVMIDASKCMGCGYCAWACPYGVPQYDKQRGIMSKCDFCYDNLDAGSPPSCVAACPLRVLDYGRIETLGAAAQGQNLWQLPASDHPYPLPNFSRTEPHLVITPHDGMINPLQKQVSNQEEVLPPDSFEARQGRGVHELPLVAFTLLLQMAVGLAVFSLGLATLPESLIIAIGVLTAAAGLISFLHLGNKRNAWRAVIHLKKSWLSREILMAGLFGMAWVVSAGAKWYWGAPLNPWPMAILGIALIFSMARVYLLRAVPGWNSWRTPAAFFLSAAVLGAMGINLSDPSPRWLIVAGLAMAAEMVLILTAPVATDKTAGRLRNILLGVCILGIVIASTFPKQIGLWLAAPILILALASEVIGRWQFYKGRIPFPMRDN
jgi:DMSO reductase iron-sulfur subunit